MLVWLSAYFIPGLAPYQPGVFHVFAYVFPVFPVFPVFQPVVEDWLELATLAADWLYAWSEPL